MNISKKTKIIIKELNEKLIEREHIVPILLLTLFSKSHMLLLGPPGVGKTYAIELITHFTKDLKYFEYLITNNTLLDELFGSKIVDNEGNMVYNIEHSMLDSHICFIDELYKAPSTLINSLLGITHTSRSFFQRGRGKLTSPMISMFAASNELPENEAVDAFDDRILFRFWVDEIRDITNFKRFAKRDFDRTKTFSTHFSTDDLAYIHEESKNIFIHDDFVALYTNIRIKLATEKVFISDRKLQSSLDILQTSAYINERNYVDLSELFLLLDIAWKRFEDIERVKRIIFDTIFGNPSEVASLLKNNQDYFKAIQAQIRSQANILNYSYEYNGTNAEKNFNTHRETILSIKNNVQIVFLNFQGLKDNYLFAMKMENMIEKNVFIPNYKNHIYDSDVVGEKRVNKNEIFEFASHVSIAMNKLNEWLNESVELYDYNNLKAKKSVA